MMYLSTRYRQRLLDQFLFIPCPSCKVDRSDICQHFQGKTAGARRSGSDPHWSRAETEVPHQHGEPLHSRSLCIKEPQPLQCPIRSKSPSCSRLSRMIFHLYRQDHFGDGQDHFGELAPSREGQNRTPAVVLDRHSLPLNARHGDSWVPRLPESGVTSELFVTSPRTQLARNKQVNIQKTVTNTNSS